MFQAKL